MLFSMIESLIRFLSLQSVLVQVEICMLVLVNWFANGTGIWIGIWVLIVCMKTFTLALVATNRWLQRRIVCTYCVNIYSICFKAHISIRSALIQHMNSQN